MNEFVYMAKEAELKKTAFVVAEILCLMNLCFIVHLSPY